MTVDFHSVAVACSIDNVEEMEDQERDERRALCSAGCCPSLERGEEVLSSRVIQIVDLLSLTKELTAFLLPGLVPTDHHQLTSQVFLLNLL